MNAIHRLVHLGLFMTLCSLSLSVSLPAYATEEFTLTIKDHTFTPATLEVPVNQKIKLVIVNNDPTPEEFESYDLHREKIVQGNGKITVFIGPLKAGTYSYFGEFNQDAAKGTIIAK